MNIYKLYEKVMVLSIMGLFIGAGVINNVNGKTFSNLDTIYVDDDNTEGPWDGTQEHPYQYIQDALDAVPYAGDTIVWVEDGNYSENLIIKTSNTDLIGNGDNVKVTGSLGDVVIVNNDLVDVSIQKFILKSDYRNHKTAGIYVGIKCEKIIISDNDISDCMFGVWLDRKSTGITISANEIYNIEYYGIYVQMESDNNLIRENHISNCTDGLHIEDCYNCLIYDNIVEGNMVGIYFGVGIENRIESNIIRDNKNYGLWLINMWNNVISGNSFSKNGGLSTMTSNAFFVDSRNDWRQNEGLSIIFGYYEFGLPVHIPTFQIDLG